MRYIVYVNRTIEQVAKFDVDASSRAEAELLAREEVQNIDTQLRLEREAINKHFNEWYISHIAAGEPETLDDLLRAP